MDFLLWYLGWIEGNTALDGYLLGGWFWLGVFVWIPGTRVVPQGLRSIFGIFGWEKRDGCNIPPAIRCGWYLVNMSLGGTLYNIEFGGSESEICWKRQRMKGILRVPNQMVGWMGSHLCGRVPCLQIAVIHIPGLRR
ncbi:hypothetical protein VTJ04DRAFT_10519 [Mycothermus thermophilus]|uniref:uncharacterized protein n=1 Tax=Humicola insolens TaxID=85995 RepID=UPI0037435C2F